jgi:hypothetical protein
MSFDLIDAKCLVGKIPLAKARILGYNPWRVRFVFEMAICLGISMAGVHLYGFVKKNQPAIEGQGIALYSLLSLLAVYSYPQPQTRWDNMERGRKRKHLRLIKSSQADETVNDPEREILEELENLEELEFQILTGAPDWTVAIDRRSPTEVKLRVLAAVKSYTLGNKSVDHLLRRYREIWEKKLPEWD